MTTQSSLAALCTKTDRAELVEAPLLSFVPESMIAPRKIQPFDKLRVGGNRGSRVKPTIKIGKRGSSLAFRIPKAIAERFNLKVGDTIDSSIIERALVRSSVEPERNEA